MLDSDWEDLVCVGTIQLNDLSYLPDDDLDENVYLELDQAEKTGLGLEPTRELIGVSL